MGPINKYIFRTQWNCIHPVRLTDNSKDLLSDRGCVFFSLV